MVHADGRYGEYDFFHGDIKIHIYEEKNRKQLSIINKLRKNIYLKKMDMFRKYLHAYWDFFFTQLYSYLYVTIKIHCTFLVIYMHMGAAAKISEPNLN